MRRAIILLLVSACTSAKSPNSNGKENFAKIKTNKNIQVDMRYFSKNNFTLEVVDGYKANVCYLAKPVAKALKGVATDLKKQGYGLYLFDCYRPQKGVDHFIRWAKAPDQPLSKKTYYPKLEKNTLFNGYIAEKSGHSRGSTVDLSIYKLSDKKPTPVKMGTPFDFFSELSHTANPNISKLAKTNRMILKKAMEARGFENYRREWWHYTFKPEPYPKTYFNFDVTE